MENNKEERRKHVRRPDRPTITELRAVFHRLWTAQVGQPLYSKRDWRELSAIIFRLTRIDV
jgi:hypothetical protein